MRWLSPNATSQEHRDQWASVLKRHDAPPNLVFAVKDYLWPEHEVRRRRPVGTKHLANFPGGMTVTDVGPLLEVSPKIVAFVGLAGTKPREAGQIASSLAAALRVRGLPCDIHPLMLLRDLDAVGPQQFLPLLHSLLDKAPYLINVEKYLGAPAGHVHRSVDWRPYRVFSLVPEPDDGAVNRNVPRTGWQTGLYADVESSQRLVDQARFMGLGKFLPHRFWEIPPDVRGLLDGPSEEPATAAP